MIIFQLVYFQDTETKDDVSSVKMNSEQSNQWHRSGVAHSFDPRNIQIISLDNPRAFMHKGFLLESECDLLMVRALSLFFQGDKAHM